MTESFEGETVGWSGRRKVAAGIVGNVLEWYDFGVYGFFAPIIAIHFFPADNPTTSLVATFGAFAAGFLMRPVGAAVFGPLPSCWTARAFCGFLIWAITASRVAARSRWRLR